LRFYSDIPSDLRRTGKHTLKRTSSSIFGNTGKRACRAGSKSV
jgi:hypothetical protein